MSPYPLLSIEILEEDYLTKTEHFWYWHILSLSDEMGLGKTLQCIATLWYVSENSEQLFTQTC